MKIRTVMIWSVENRIAIYIAIVITITINRMPFFFEHDEFNFMQLYFSNLVNSLLIVVTDCDVMSYRRRNDSESWMSLRGGTSVNSS